VCPSPSASLASQKLTLNLFPKCLVPIPSLETVTSLLSKPSEGNCVPIFVTLPADLLTPVLAYLRISQGSKHSFLLESISGGENISRYSFIGASTCRIKPTLLPSLPYDPLC
jgi:anthranilate synthase component 1